MGVCANNIEVAHHFTASHTVYHMWYICQATNLKWYTVDMLDKLKKRYPNNLYLGVFFFLVSQGFGAEEYHLFTVLMGVLCVSTILGILVAVSDGKFSWQKACRSLSKAGIYIILAASGHYASMHSELVSDVVKFAMSFLCGSEAVGIGGNVAEANILPAKANLVLYQINDPQGKTWKEYEEPI